MALGLSPKLPLSLSPKSGYTLTTTIPEMVKQNLKCLMLTNPGERLMDNNFGIGLKKFLFEQNTTSTKGELRSRIESQLSQYMPFLTITNLVLAGEENEIYIELYYNIDPISVLDRITFSSTTFGNIATI